MFHILCSNVMKLDKEKHSIKDHNNNEKPLFYTL